MHYAATQPQNVLAHPLRLRLFSLTLSRPGILFSDARRELDCSSGSLQHHLKVLERGGFTQSWRVHGRRHLFRTDVQPQEQATLMTLIRKRRSLDLLAAVARRPGIRQHELARSLSLSRKVIIGSVRELEELGLLASHRLSPGRMYTATAMGADLSGQALAQALPV